MHYPRTGLEISIKHLQDFFSSWVCQDGHCYITHCDDKTFNVAMNFPYSDQIILRQITTLIKDKAIIPGEFSGLQFELRFYHACVNNSNVDFKIVLANNSVLTLAMEVCISDDIKGNLTEGVLYKLYPYHPAVDYVGVLRVQGNREIVYLTFFQLSISTYLNHNLSKVWHLLQKYDKYKDLKNATVLEYYKSLQLTYCTSMFHLHTIIFKDSHN